MKRTNNKGVSLIEILIAVVIFTLCITPIVNQLMVGMRISQKADDQQAATDYAKSVAETMKQMQLNSVYSTTELEDLADVLAAKSVTTTTNDDGSVTTNTTYNLRCVATFYSIKADGTDGLAIPKNSYLSAQVPTLGEGETLGTAFTSVDAVYQELNRHNKAVDPTDPSAPQEPEALVREYRFIGKSTIDYRDYDIDITMDTKPYALESLNTPDYADPNAANLGNLSDLDATKTAVITSTSNYDAVAGSAFFNAVITALENTGSSTDAQIAEKLKNGETTFIDSATKQIKITITELPDSAANDYEVVCSIHYVNTSIIGDYSVNPADAQIDYVAYHQQFTGSEPPDVYLMYNQFMYNKKFGNDDIIIENDMDQEAKVYVVRTAETNEGVREALNSGLKDLVPTETQQARDEKDGSEYLYKTNFQLNQDPNDHPVSIFTNIPLKQQIGTDAGGQPVYGSNLTNSSAADVQNYKMSVNVSNPAAVVKEMKEDERYSETGRVYNIVISVTNQDSGNTTTIDTSKGDY